jgi:hypothetical protein
LPGYRLFFNVSNASKNEYRGNVPAWASTPLPIPTSIAAKAACRNHLPDAKDGPNIVWTPSTTQTSVEKREKRRGKHLSEERRQKDFRQGFCFALHQLQQDVISAPILAARIIFYLC